MKSIRLLLILVSKYGLIINYQNFNIFHKPINKLNYLMRTQRDPLKNKSKRFKSDAAIFEVFIDYPFICI
jgi:hypothetical protein